MELKLQGIDTRSACPRNLAQPPALLHDECDTTRKGVRMALPFRVTIREDFAALQWPSAFIDCAARWHERGRIAESPGQLDRRRAVLAQGSRALWVRPETGRRTL